MNKKEKHQAWLQARWGKICKDLFEALEKHCRREGWQQFSKEEVLRLCALKERAFRERDEMEADVRLLQEIDQAAAELSERASAGVGNAIQILARHAIENYAPVVAAPMTEARRKVLDSTIYQVVEYLKRCGVPQGRELYAVTAGILIYTGAVEAENLGLDDAFDVFDASSEKLGQMRKGPVYRAWKRVAGRVRGESGRPDADFSRPPVSDLPAASSAERYPKGKYRITEPGLPEWRPAPPLARGTILPKAKYRTREKPENK